MLCVTMLFEDIHIIEVFFNRFYVKTNPLRKIEYKADEPGTY